MGELVNAGYSAQLYDATNGLETSDINYILGSSKGYIWIGGYSGISRYDGSKIIKIDDVEGMSNARVIYEDTIGRIWVGTNDNGVYYMENDVWNHFSKDDGLSSSSIRSFAEDNKGNIYVGTTNGVSYINLKKEVHIIDDSRIAGQRVLKVSADRDGIVYGQSKEGNVFSFEDGKVTSYYSSSDLGIEKISTILVNPKRSGIVYYGTEEDKIYYGRFGSSVDSLKCLSVSPLKNVHWMNYGCGRIWLSSTNTIGYLDAKQNFHAVENLPMNSSIEMTTCDYQGNLWAASSKQGIMKIVVSNFIDYTERAAVDDKVVNSTAVVNGVVYVGRDDGLVIIDAKGKAIENELTEYFKDVRIRCIKIDHKGELWISTFTGQKGLVHVSKDGSIEEYTVEDGMPSNEVRCTDQTSAGAILACTNGGLATIKDGKVGRIIGTEHVTNTVFLSVIEGDNADLYVGTDGDGIYIIKGTKIKKLGTKDGLTSDVIRRIKKDPIRGGYWIITSNSIQYMKNEKIKTITSFPYDTNYDIQFATDNTLWVLASNGVYHVNASDMVNDKIERFNLYTLGNGLTSMPVLDAYSDMDSNGNLYISGMTGVSKINIYKTFDFDAPIKIDIGSLTYNEKKITPGVDGVFVIPKGEGRLRITPAVLDYTFMNPYIHVYLEGYADEGMYTLRENLTPLEYTGLHYGNYKLHVQILDDQVKRVLQDEVFIIKKEPRFYELRGFIITLVLLFVLVGGGIVWFFMRITIIRNQYDMIRQAKDEAVQANLAKSRFLANMSHEIRTPINTIMGMDEMILREDATDVPKDYMLSVVNYAMDIRSASESLLGLINDVLDISKIESGKMHLVEQEYAMEELLRSVVSMIKIRTEQKDLTFEVKIDEDLPKSLYGDCGKIKQIILNLLTNAVKYTEEGGFTLSVGSTGRTNDRISLRISVKDTGIGVKEEDIDKLFSAYERLDEAKNSGIQGTGLGLDISRRFAELMKGRLWCESVYGEGSEFILCLDQEIRDATPMGKFIEHDSNALAKRYVPQFVAPDASVLVVDDNSMNLSVIKGLLKATRMTVVTASGGQECLDILEKQQFDIILLDHMMPGMDGLETVKNIRERYGDVVVYALTANTAVGEEFYKSKGFDGYLSKPIDSQTLEKTIRSKLPKDKIMQATEEDGIEEEQVSDDMLWIYDVPGISPIAGISNSGGVESYVYALNLFYETIEKNSDIIEKAYKEKDIKLYTIKVHSLKSSARIVGAIQLSALAEQLEAAGNKEDLDFISEHTEELLIQYREYKDRLAKFEKIKKEDTSNKEAIDPQELESAYEALGELIPQMDYDGVEMVIEQLKDYSLSEEDAKKLKDLEFSLKQFDWDAMEAIIK